MQGKPVQSLIREDPICHEAAKPMHPNHWAHVLQVLRPWAQSLCSTTREAQSLQGRVAPTGCKQRKPSQRNEDPAQPKINRIKNKKLLFCLLNKNCYPVFLFLFFDNYGEAKKKERCEDIWQKHIHICVCVCMCVCARMLRHFNCLTLCNSMDSSPPDSSVHGILQARILENTEDCIAVSFSKGSSWPRDQSCISYVSCIGGQVLYH